MCWGDTPDPPKPAPAPPPAPVLDQTAPEFTDEKKKKSKARRSGTKRYRTGGNLSITANKAASNGGLSIPGGR